jgi:hypothetical protein
MPHPYSTPRERELDAVLWVLVHYIDTGSAINRDGPTMTKARRILLDGIPPEERADTLDSAALSVAKC